MEGPKPLAHEAVHVTVEQLLAGSVPGRLLDVPAGEGALTAPLERLGFEVTCADLYPEIFKLDGHAVIPADLDAKLPFEDNSFEYVVCVEGLEHIENPANAIREFSRVLSADGKLIVSVPNIMNIEERFKWLISGHTSHFRPLSSDFLARVRSDHPGIEEAALHINPIGYAELRYLLEANGFAVTGNYRDKAKANGWAFRPVAGLIRLISRFSPAEKRRERWADELNSDEILLGGNTLILTAQKL
jgi:SAM-dependent methyltransferase